MLDGLILGLKSQMAVEASREGRELYCLVPSGELGPERIGISGNYEGFFSSFFVFVWCVCDSPDLHILASHSN